MAHKQEKIRVERNCPYRNQGSLAAIGLSRSTITITFKNLKKTLKEQPVKQGFDQAMASWGEPPAPTPECLGSVLAPPRSSFLPGHA